MNILSIDQSYTSTGYCVFINNQLKAYGSIQTDKEQDSFTRCSELVSEILRVVDGFDITHIGLEGLAFSMVGNATRDLAGLQFVLVTELRKVLPKEKITIVPPLSVKKTATGNGKASKKEMVDALPDATRLLFKQSGYTSTKGLPDLADAYWIGQHLLSTLTK